MYIEELKKRQGEKIYKSVLIRESYRDKNGKVKHRTIANISKLPVEYIYELKRLLKGVRGGIQTSDLGTGVSYEYGGSYVFREVAGELGLDRAIYSRRTQWREDVLAMIIGRILYQGSKLSLTNHYPDTGLWEVCGHRYGERVDVEKHCYKALDKLLLRKKDIERHLVKKHLRKGCVVIYDITNAYFEGEYNFSEKVKYGKSKDNKCGYKQISLGLITTSEGCPVGVEIFSGNVSEQKTVLDQIKKLKCSYGIEEAVFVGDRGMLTSKRISELTEEGYKTISALNHCELKKFIEGKAVQMELFDERNITEIVDKESGVRYMLCRNETEMRKERETRNSLIEKVKSLLTAKSNVKRKRNAQRVAASVGKIFQKYPVEKFFDWHVEEDGKLNWTVKEEKVAEEEKLDGCYAIKTTVSCKNMSKEEVVGNYRSIQKVEQAFKNMKTVILEIRPVYHKTDRRIEAHIFLVMLAYYLQYHAMQRLKTLFENDGIGSQRRWSFPIIIERLKAIRKTEIKIKDITIKYSVSQPDEEQKTILKLLNVKMP